MRLNEGDPGFKHEVAATPGGEGLKACFSCAACSARCPVVAQRPEYDPRRLIRLTLLGRREEVLSSPQLWLCASCYTCQEVCPQGVRFTDLCTALKNLAAKAGHAPASSRVMAKLLASHGRLLNVGEFENEKRAELGLPPVRECPDDFQAILGITPEAAQAGEGS